MKKSPEKYNRITNIEEILSKGLAMHIEKTTRQYVGPLINDYQYVVDQFMRLLKLPHNKLLQPTQKPRG